MIEAYSPSATIFDGLIYKRDASPDKVTSDLSEGINCLTFIHLYWEEILGWFVLPKEDGYTGYNFYTNSELFLEVPAEGPFINGDVFLFGPEGLTDLHKLHLALFIGEYDEHGQPILEHATNHRIFRELKPQGGVFDTSLDQMLEQPQWRKLHGVRRWKK